MAKKGDCILNRFTVQNELDNDDGCTVYLADDTENGSVVLREYLIASLDSWEVLDRLEKRAEQYSEFSCDSLPRFIGWYSDDSSDDPAVYFVHEHINGISLKRVVESNGPLSCGEVEAMLRNLLKGLNCLHQLDPPVVHAGVSPAVIVRDQENSYRFANLPLPALFSQRTSGPGGNLTESVYNPPSTRRGTASDMYGMGMSCVYGLTGKHPVKGQFGVLRSAGELGQIIGTMIDTASYRTPSAAELLSLLSQSGQMVSEEIGTDTTGNGEEFAVEIASSATGDTVSVYNPNASRAESLLIGFFLDMWAKRPWIIILIAAALSAGPIAIPLIIFLFHPKSKILLNRAYAKYRDVFLHLGNRGLSVSDQIKAVDYSEIIEHETREIPGISGIQLETILKIRGGKEKRFYLNSLNRADARRISGLIDKRLMGG